MYPESANNGQKCSPSLSSIFSLPPQPISGKQCSCLNPTIPAVPAYIHDEPKEEGAVGWNGTTKMNIQLINETLSALSSSSSSSSTSEEERERLDVVLLGDSITEHWNGRDMGVFRPKDYNVSLVFQELFQKRKNGSSVEGLALGIAGDRVSIYGKFYCWVGVNFEKEISSS